MSRSQSGFTLIELMIGVAIIGVLAAIALPAFAEYARHSKTAEAQLALDTMLKNIKVYANQKSVLPPSAAKMPAVSACDAGLDKAPAAPKSVWTADPGWAAIQFHIDEPTYYQYEWDQFSPTDGQAVASADFDCDNIPAQLIISATIVEGFTIEQQQLELVDD